MVCVLDVDVYIVKEALVVFMSWVVVFADECHRVVVYIEGFALGDASLAVFFRAVYPRFIPYCAEVVSREFLQHPRRCPLLCLALRLEEFVLVLYLQLHLLYLFVGFLLLYPVRLVVDIVP